MFVLTTSAEIYSMGMTVGISEKAPGLLGLTKKKMRHGPRICSRISAIQNVLGDLMRFMLFIIIKFGSLEWFITGDECL